MKITAFLLLAMTWFFSACAPVTPQQRIEKNPALYQSLPAKHQALVARGEISRGMSPDAVTLAWGAPSRRYTGESNSTRTERWDYFGSEPQYTNRLAFGYGYGHGYRRHGYYNSIAYAPEITYIPYRRATVLFKNQLVDTWETMQSPPP